MKKNTELGIITHESQSLVSTDDEDKAGDHTQGKKRPIGDISYYNNTPKVHRFRNHLNATLSVRAGRFRHGPVCDVRNFITTSVGCQKNATEPSSGNTWVAVNGIKANCVVGMDTLRDQHRGKYSPEHRSPILLTLQTVLSQLLDKSSPISKIACPLAERKPFAVVSVAPDTFEGDLESVDKATSRPVDFLVANLGHSAMTCKDIKSIAVCALKYVLGPKFKSDRIVAVCYDGVSWNGRFGELSTRVADLYLSFDKSTNTQDSAIINT